MRSWRLTSLTDRRSHAWCSDVPALSNNRASLSRPYSPRDSLHTKLRKLVDETVELFDGWDDGEVQIRVHARAGKPAQQVVELAAEAEADVIFLGRHGVRERGRLELGSVPAQVLKTASCPVMVLQVPDYGPHEVDPADQCTECVATRSDTSGETWFCSKHSGEWSWRTSYMRLGFSNLGRNQGVWF